MTTRTEQRLVAALKKKKHGDSSSLAERAIMSVGRAQIILKKLHEAGSVRIVGWKRPQGSGALAAIWAWGKGADAPRPAKLTNAERCRRYQAALRARLGKDYTAVRKAQETRVPGRTIVIGGKKVYQQ